MNRFLEHLLGVVSHQNIERSRFDTIVGRPDIKKIFISAIKSSQPVHILLVGPAGSAKTMFLTEMLQFLRGSYFVVASNATKAGLVSQLFERRPRFLLLDELEKMKDSDQTSLLHLMETGIIAETKVNKTRQMQLTSWVFATANSCQTIIKPLLSRFLVLEIPEYTFQEFMKIAIFRLKKEKVGEKTAIMIAEKVWNELKSKDIRDVVKLGRLTSDSKDLSMIISIIKRTPRTN
jgi:holliday junction DNA helicase RuvB